MAVVAAFVILLFSRTLGSHLCSHPPQFPTAENYQQVPIGLFVNGAGDGLGAMKHQLQGGV